jgi:8-oxo-dGTP pyrophosphatase MutT (NUDIX family)
MGAGILPTTIHQGKLYFLFGKENQYEDFAKGFSDFGGGTDNKESFLETAIREGGEELTGFLGSDVDLKKMLKKGVYTLDYKSETHSTYRTHIFAYPYDPYLEKYYNNNQRFLQKRLDPKVYQHSKLFEKAEIRWFCIDELFKKRGQFRNFYQNIIDLILEEREKIHAFLLKKREKSGKKTRKNRKTE